MYGKNSNWIELRMVIFTKMWHWVSDLLLAYVQGTAFDASADGSQLISMHSKFIDKLNLAH